MAIGIILLFLEAGIIPTIAHDGNKRSLPTSSGQWLYVGGSGPGNYSKIQDAINDSNNGDTIFVFHGTYYENINIDKIINLVGEEKNSTIIDGNAKHDVIYIGFPANNVKITGFTIRNSGNSSSGGGNADAGIEIHSDYNMIQNNIISNHPRYGIWLWASRGNNISYNSITACNVSGIDFLAGPCNIISHNLIYKNYFGINTRLSSNTTANILFNNTFLDNRRGLWIYDSGSHIFCNNFINNSDFNAVSFFNSRRMNPSRNSWERNYWDDWRSIGPKWIPGVIGLNFDWHPVQEPYPYQTIPLLRSQSDPDGVATKWAVVIACSGGFTYERHERCDRNDVRELTQLLKKNGWDENHILSLQEEQATTEAILDDSFQWLTENREDEDDLIFFFFSGHGYYHTTDDPPVDEPDGRDEVINPWDPDIAGWNPDVFIVDDTLSAKFDTLESNNIVIVIHTCHAGGWIDGESDLCGSGRVVLVACGVDEASCMMKYPVHWLFAYYLIQGLKGHADVNNDNSITAEELLNYTIKPVEFRSKIFNWITSGVPTIQHPELYDGWPSEENNTEELKLIEL